MSWQLYGNAVSVSVLKVPALASTRAGHRRINHRSKQQMQSTSQNITGAGKRHNSKQTPCRRCSSHENSKQPVSKKGFRSQAQPTHGESIFGPSRIGKSAAANREDSPELNSTSCSTASSASRCGGAEVSELLAFTPAAAPIVNTGEAPAKFPTPDSQAFRVRWAACGTYIDAMTFGYTMIRAFERLERRLAAFSGPAEVGKKEWITPAT